MRLGELLRKKRENEFLSIKVISDRSGYSIAYLSEIELNKKIPKSRDILEKLSEVYDIPISKIIKATKYSMNLPIIIERIRDTNLPVKANETDAGIDLFYPNDAEEYVLAPGKLCKLPIGIKMKLPEGYALVNFNRSSMGSKGIILGACVIDEGYRGEVMINLINTTDKDYVIKPGDKLCQGLLIKVPKVSIYEDKVENDTERGSGGFGSSGR